MATGIPPYFISYLLSAMPHKAEKTVESPTTINAEPQLRPTKPLKEKR